MIFIDIDMGVTVIYFICDFELFTPFYLWFYLRLHIYWFKVMGCL